MKMEELRCLALADRMIPGAPVAATRALEVEASIQRVWELLTEVSRWENWYPYLRNAHLAGPFAADTKLSYGGLIKHDLRVAKVRRPNLVMIYGKLLGYSAVTRWELQERSTSRTRVTFTESSVGVLIAALYSEEKLGRHLSRWLEKLKAEAERQ